MANPVTSIPRLWALLFTFLGFQPCVFAHRLDEYLQATLVAIEPDEIRLAINLTPGVIVAEQVLALVDRDRDGVISPNEAADYAELLRRDLIVRVDQRNLELKPDTSKFPVPSEFRTGWGIIQMEFSVAASSLGEGPHKFTLENRHLTNASVYLFNAALPKSRSVQIIRQIRNENQSQGEIVYSFHAPTNPSRTLGIVALLLALLVVLSLAGRRAGMSLLRGT
jgi:hypothetical protein